MPKPAKPRAPPASPSSDDEDVPESSSDPPPTRRRTAGKRADWRGDALVCTECGHEVIPEREDEVITECPNCKGPA